MDVYRDSIKYIMKTTPFMGGVAYLEPCLSGCHVRAHLSGVLETEPVAISESPG